MKKLYISEEQKKHLQKAIAAQDQVGGKVNAGIMGAVTGMVCEAHGDDIQTWYRGYNADLPNLGVPNGGGLWLTDEYDYAKQYADHFDNGKVAAVTIDFTKINWATETEIYDSDLDPYESGPMMAKAVRKLGFNAWICDYYDDNAQGLCLLDMSAVVSVEDYNNEMIGEGVEDGQYKLGFEKGGFEPNGHILNETPDSVYNFDAGWRDDDCIAFLYSKKDDDLLVGRGTTHHRLIIDDGGSPDDDENYGDTEMRGRYWSDRNLISFWQTPSPVKLRFVVERLKKHFYTLNIDTKTLIVDVWDWGGFDWEVPYQWFFDGFLDDFSDKILRINLEDEEKFTFRVEFKQGGVYYCGLDGVLKPQQSEYAAVVESRKKVIKNDEGKVVPEKCDKCGEDVVLQIHGEPVYVCKKCGKYFGTMPFSGSLKETTDNYQGESFKRGNTITFVSLSNNNEIYFTNEHGATHERLLQNLMKDGVIEKTPIEWSKLAPMYNRFQTGRYWVDFDVISFWETPSSKENRHYLRNVVEKLKLNPESLDIDFWDTRRNLGIQSSFVLPYKWFFNGTLDDLLQMGVYNITKTMYGTYNVFLDNFKHYVLNRNGEVINTNESRMIKENHEWCDNFEYTPYLKSISKFLQDNGINVKPFPRVKLHKEEQEGLYIKTGFYDPDERKVHLFIKDRHPKDVLRSFTHEMIHHSQNLRGELVGYKGETLQGDNILQKLESEAYLKGNIYFRKWTEELRPNIPITKHKINESEGDNITTWYRGYNSKFGNQKTHLLWLSSSLRYAASYGDKVIEYKVDESKCNGSIDDLGSETDYYAGPDYNEAQELLAQGINCYFFDAANDAETLVLWDKSPIVSEKVMDTKEVKAKLGLLNESIQDIYNMQEDWDEFGVSSLLSEFFRDKKRGITKKQWDLIPAQQYQNLLTRYMQDPITARIPDNVVYNWFEKVVKNAFDIEYITELAGHSQWFPADEVQEEFDAWIGEKYQITDYMSGYEALEAEGFYEWCSLPDGSDGWSDYGLEPIFNELSYYKPNMPAGDLLILINRVLHIGHCRGDLASAFIEGGSQSCSAISGIIRESFDMGEITNPEDVDLSSFEVKDELNPKFWKDDRIDSRIRIALLDIADDFIETLDVDWVKPTDIIVTGSLASFNWSSEHSDIDLHIVMDYTEVDDNIALVKDYFDSKRRLWNEEHGNITIAGFPVELYVQDIDEPHASSGVYSLEKDKWLVKPDVNNFDTDYDESVVKHKVSKYMNEIDDLYEEYEDSLADCDLSELHKKAVVLFKKIKDERKNGFENGGGEYNVGNLIFKSLRRNGYIEKLDKIKVESYDSLKSIYNENKVSQ